MLEDNLQDSVLSFHCVGSGDPILLIKLGVKHLSSVRHLSGLTLPCMVSGKLDAILHSPTGKELHSNFIQKFLSSLLSL